MTSSHSPRPRRVSRKDPVAVVGDALAATDDPGTVLALVVRRLVVDGTLTVDALCRVGLSGESVASLLSAYEASSSVEEFVHRLDVYAAARTFDSAFAVIAAERGVVAGGSGYCELRSAVASFAEENDLLDVRLAYRLMLAECPERLPCGEPAR